MEDCQVRYLRNKLPKYSLTVVCRRSDKVVCRSNSLCFFAVHAPTHVSLEICIFRCLVGHVFQRSSPVDRNMFLSFWTLNPATPFPLLSIPHFVGARKLFCFFPIFFRKRANFQNCSKLHLSETAFGVCTTFNE